MCRSNREQYNRLSWLTTGLKKGLWLCSSIFMVYCWLIAHCDRVTADSHITTQKAAKNLAIIQTIEHESLDQARAGVLNALAYKGYVEHENLIIQYHTAHNDPKIANHIIQQLIVSNPDAIVAIGTMAAQSALRACREANIPVIYSSITDPETAGLIHNQMTGSLDFPPLNENITLIHQYVPTLKNLGIVYSAAEINSLKVVLFIRDMVKTLGIELVESVVTSSAQVSSAMASLIGRVDAVYLPSDNTVFSAMDTVVKILEQNNLPVFSSDPDSIRKGVLAGIGFSQKDVGYLAGEFTAQILDGVDIKTLTPRTPMDSHLYINEDTDNLLQLTIDEGVKNNAIKVRKISEDKL